MPSAALGNEPAHIRWFCSGPGLLALIQQCIRGIELIGSRLLGRDDEVAALRLMRDELLGKTQAGREWILLFERVQAPLVGIVVADERLAGQAAALVVSAGRLAGTVTSTKNS